MLTDSKQYQVTLSHGTESVTILRKLVKPIGKRDFGEVSLALIQVKNLTGHNYDSPIEYLAIKITSFE